MTYLSYRERLEPHRLTPACEPRPVPQIGAVLFTSDGTFDVTEAGIVRRERAEPVLQPVRASEPWWVSFAGALGLTVFVLVMLTVWGIFG